MEDKTHQEKPSLKLNSNDYLYLLCIPTILTLLIIVFINRSPSYQVNATITLSNIESFSSIKGKNLKGLDRPVRRMIRMQQRLMLSNNRTTQAERLATLKSRSFFESYIDSHEVKPLLFPKRWDNEKETWKSRKRGIVGIIRTYFEEDQRKVSNREPRTFLAVKILKNKFRVKIEAKTGLIYISSRWKSAEIGEKITNEIINYANIYIANQKRDTLEKQIRQTNLLLEKSQPHSIRRFLNANLTAYQHGLAFNDPEFNPSFKVLIPAYAPEEPTLRFPKLRLLLVLIVGFISTYLWIMVSKLRKFDKGLQQKNKASLNNSTSSVTPYTSS
ncbi:hypothetical protein [Teredinibacter sp. KSP-S5-2]|uniref:hypothetical protein n=1 Tax=Teredinibacter sp. KSP-S5-2 TaxID=3034506 RepID=UPI0029350713|nr:hypothetical protein [Teredinibacter sp. KSP-S5-2]WNO09088.1 hypothetical protein P5V12_19275 [Teredinibacter sp. KSP-S5-2]